MPSRRNSLALILLLGACAAPEAPVAPSTSASVTVDGIAVTVRRTRYLRPPGVPVQMPDGTPDPAFPVAHEGPDGDPAVAVAGLPLGSQSWARAERAIALACGIDIGTEAAAMGLDLDLGGTRAQAEGSEIFYQMARCPGLDS